MQPAEPHLVIDYGTACTQAVVVWPGGAWEPLTFDGALELSSAVHTAGDDGQVVGAAAWRHAATVADGFVPSPLAVLDGPDSGAVTVPGGIKVPVADLAVATLRHVGAVAAARVGGPITDVRMVVPAGWGPRRRTWLRQVALRAGLGQPRLVEAPVAAAQRWLAGGMHLPVGALLLICDLGAGCEATVLRRGPAGFEVLSTLADPQAGTAAIDDHLLTTLTSPDGAAAADGARWATAAALRTARESLTHQAAVTVPMPASAPTLVVHAHLVEEAAAPVLTQAGDLAARAVAAADLTVGQLTGVYLIGGAAVMPAAAPAIGAQLGAVPQVVTQPGFAAVLGAADTTTPAGTQPGAAAGPAGVQMPPLRRMGSVLIAGVASLALFAQMLFTADFEGGTRRDPHWILVTWGELTLATTVALVGALSAASWLGTALAHAQPHLPAPGRAGEVAVVRAAGGITLAVLTGLAIAALYAVAAAAYLGLWLSLSLRWAVLPLLPVTAVLAAMAWTLRDRQQALNEVDAVLAFPASSIVFTTTGMLLVVVWWSVYLPPALSSIQPVLRILGGVLVGIGIACTLARSLPLRGVLAVFLAVFCVAVAGAGHRTLALTGGPGILALLYTGAVTVWAVYRLWQLTRLPVTAHAR
ncbi:Hsp70 family protein [Jidongwangia harbinensis]|uniref:Hsp70 family protein n=1 Tax=Jidongwangia harbinensis TaxID=2878561 RepID=UPI001CD9F8FA|nr:Hsp70 family protein [Jidongwangia harbinensis]MCA2216302.1 Hsp70 family protein [Jidongwangia harbinensis]MCA2217037.1 Hsp70 family protein [Jidongwangia harbinensis]